eukprot:sb/3466530/
MCPLPPVNMSDIYVYLGWEWLWDGNGCGMGMVVRVTMAPDLSLQRSSSSRRFSDSAVFTTAMTCFSPLRRLRPTPPQPPSVPISQSGTCIPSVPEEGGGGGVRVWGAYRSRQPIITPCLGHVTGYQPFRTSIFCFGRFLGRDNGRSLHPATRMIEETEPSINPLRRLRATPPQPPSVPISQSGTSISSVPEEGGGGTTNHNSLFRSRWTGYQPIRDQYFLIRSVFLNTGGCYSRGQGVVQASSLSISLSFSLSLSPSLSLSIPLSFYLKYAQEPSDTSNQPIRTRYLGHVTGYQPIRDQYFLIRSVTPFSCHQSFIRLITCHISRDMCSDCSMII